jgi:predicted MFS family arabinose efflux permease
VARTLILPILIGPGAAPILGGVLTETLSWRFVFLINVPVGVATIAFAYLYLPDHRETLSGRLDVLGMLLSGVGLSALLYAISEGAVIGWATPRILVTGVGGILLLWAFARRALRIPEPILRLRLLREPLLRGTNIVFVLTTGMFLASLYVTPIFLQQVLHQSPISSGTTTFAEVIGVAVGAQTLGRLYPRLGPRVLAVTGAIALTAYMALFLLVSPGVSMWPVRALMFFGGLGNAGTFLSIQTSVFTHISSRDTGHASAIYNTVRQSSIAVDIAVLTTVVSAAGGGLSAFHAAYLTGAILCAVGGVLAWTLISTDAARSTMRHRSESEHLTHAATAGTLGD